MMIQILKSKLHRAIITEVHLDYEGSCAIDEELLEAASINEYEMIHIYNLNNLDFVTNFPLLNQFRLEELEKVRVYQQ